MFISVMAANLRQQFACDKQVAARFNDLDQRDIVQVIYLDFYTNLNTTYYVLNRYKMLNIL